MAEITTRMPTLVIVESPAKAKALRQYLGAGYVVRASLGHVRDLPPKALGVDLTAGFSPTYQILPRARKTLADLKSAIAECNPILLATDPDREGEAIAWHLAQACRAELKGKRVQRARFHEITPEAVRAAVAAPSALDMRLVDAQQARRVLDRLVGYQISPVLWRGIAGPAGLSAGRVQSVALRLVVERDRAIEAFVPEEYWTLDAELACPDQPHFRARLYQIARQKPELKTEAAVQAVTAALAGADWRVGEVNPARRARNPYPPYITSTLQRDASARLHWPAKKVMGVAQELYEGVTLPGEGQVGLITYMRTDSTNVAEAAQQAARAVIERVYGAEALPDRPPVYAKKVKNAQEAHEAIRPTHPEKFPKALRELLTPDQDALYTLIWRRFIASQMKPALYAVTTVTVLTARAGQALPYVFRAVGRQLLDPGFLRVYDAADEPVDEASAVNETLPPLAAGAALVWHRFLPEQHFTRPPAYFTDAALIQELERLGLGRPSTFATIVDTLYERGYATRVERTLRSTELGRTVCDFLLRHFPAIFDVGFTAQMEERLDDIAAGQADWPAVMGALWEPLSGLITQAETAVAGAPKIQVAAPPRGEGEPPAPRRGRSRKGAAGRTTAGRTTAGRTTAGRRGGGRPRAPAPAQVDSAAAPDTAGSACPRCGRPLVARTGKYGPFVGCSGYPECRYIAAKPPRPSTREEN